MLEVKPGRGKARFRGHNVPVEDFHDFLSAVFGTATPIPSRVSFDVRWSGHGDRQKVRDATFGFEGHYVTGSATISFTARDRGGSVIFTSDPSGQYNPTAAQGGAGLPAVGHERNGVFFH